MSASTALSVSGRLNVTRRTAPSTSIERCGSNGWFTAGLDSGPDPEEVLPHQEAMDFVGALDQLEHLGVPVEAGHAVLARRSVGPVDLHRFGGRPLEDVAGMELRHAELDPGPLAPVHEAGGGVNQQPGR